MRRSGIHNEDAKPQPLPAGVWEGLIMGNIANRQCPMCRSADISQHWTFGNSYYQCNKCGDRFPGDSGSK